jgi:hypothetical protein
MGSLPGGWDVDDEPMPKATRIESLDDVRPGALVAIVQDLGKPVELWALEEPQAIDELHGPPDRGYISLTASPQGAVWPPQDDVPFQDLGHGSYPRFGNRGWLFAAVSEIVNPAVMRFGPVNAPRSTSSCGPGDLAPKPRHHPH